MSRIFELKWLRRRHIHANTPSAAGKAAKVAAETTAAGTAAATGSATAAGVQAVEAAASEY